MGELSALPLDELLDAVPPVSLGDTPLGELLRREFAVLAQERDEAEKNAWELQRAGSEVAKWHNDAVLRADAAERERDESREEADRLRSCDCVPGVTSSKACRKCGRRGTITAEAHEAMIARFNAAERDRDRYREALREIDRVLGTTYWDDPSAGVQSIVRKALNEGGTDGA